MEKWKKVKGWTDYIVSSEGRIAKILKPEPSGEGYHRITMTKGKRRERKLIHRVVAEVFLKNIHDKPFVHHLNSNKHDNSEKNLEWVTNKENQDYVREIEKKNGHTRVHRTLSLKERRQAKKLLKIKSHREVVELTGISRHTIRRIAREDI